MDLPLRLSAGQMPQTLCSLAGHECGGAQKRLPQTSASPPLVPGTLSGRHHLPPAVPITPTSGALAAGLSAARGGDLHVSANIHAHPGSPTPTFLGWPFTPGPETGPLGGWICMRVYFWVGSQLGESERKLLREAGGSSDVPLLTTPFTNSTQQPLYLTLRLPAWIPAPWMYTPPAPWGQNGREGWQL